MSAEITKSSSLIISDISKRDLSPKSKIFEEVSEFIDTGFLAVFDNYGLSDSISVSLMIIGIYMLVKFLSKKTISIKYMYLFLASLFLIWTIFIRQLFLIVFIVFGVFLVIDSFKNKYIKSIKYAAIYFLIGIIPITLWWMRNDKHGYSDIILVKPPQECFIGYPDYQITLRKLFIAWGGDFTLWGNEAEWFLRNTMEDDKFPFSNRIYTSEYNYDSLLNLRKISNELFYTNSISDIDTRNDSLKYYVISASNRYLNSYKKEKPFSYYITNKFILLGKFIFKKGIMLPFPSLSQMSFTEKLYKSYAIIFTIFIILTGLIGSVLFVKRKSIVLNIIVFSFLFIVVFYLGVIEFRYWATIYPILVIFSAKFLTSFLRNKLDVDNKNKLC